MGGKNKTGSYITFERSENFSLPAKIMNFKISAWVRGTLDQEGMRGSNSRKEWEKERKAENSQK